MAAHQHANPRLGERQRLRQPQGLVEVGQGLVRKLQATRGLSGKGSGRKHLDRGCAKSCGAGLAVSVHGFLQVLAGRQADPPGSTTSSQGIVGEDSKRGARVRCARRSRCPQLACRVELSPYHKTATAQTGPGPALASRPPADTTCRPGYRRAPPRAPRALGPSTALRQG